MDLVGPAIANDNIQFLSPGSRWMTYREAPLALGIRSMQHVKSRTASTVHALTQT
jgi:hypothetical protein